MKLTVKQNPWLRIPAMCLALAAIILILISVFNENASAWVLNSGLLCLAVATVLNMIQICQNKKG